MTYCQICSHKTHKIIDFEQMPIANGFIKDPNQKEFFYHLYLTLCPSCLMVQLGESVNPKLLFNDHYQFISSTSKSMQKHFKIFAQEIIKIVSKKKYPLVVELGSNDGIMLQHIAKKGIDHLGIEPAENVAIMAKKKGLKVIRRFFDKSAHILSGFSEY